MTGPYADNIISLIDGRIAQAATTNRRTGTVVSRDTTGPWAAVTIDPSTVAVAVKVMAHVNTQPGDRATLTRYGSDWVVDGCFTVRGPSQASFNGSATAGSAPGASYVNTPGPISVTFTKLYDLTKIGIFVSATTSISVSADTIVHFGVLINGTDYDVVRVVCNPVNVTFSGSGRNSISSIPAGTYTIIMRWKSSTGPGTPALATSALLSLVATEEGP